MERKHLVAVNKLGLRINLMGLSRLSAVGFVGALELLCSSQELTSLDGTVVPKILTRYIYQLISSDAK